MALSEREIMALKPGPVINALMATEIMGWVKFKDVGGKRYWLDKEDDGRYQFAEDHRVFLPSENIAHTYEAEEQVPEDQRKWYCAILATMCGDLYGLSSSHWHMYHATALDRSKALLIWKKRSTQ